MGSIPVLSRERRGQVVRGAVVGIGIIVLLMLLWASRVPAQEVGRGWCCGISDCGVLDRGAVRATKRGYVVDGMVSYFLSINHSAGGRAILGPLDRSEHVGPELIPYSEARPSPDGLYWRCKYPSGERRCFFAPPPGS